MKIKGPSTMNELLNMAEALIACKAGSIKELGAELLPEKDKNAQYARTHEWVKQRLHPISRPELIFKLQSWSVEKINALKGDRLKAYNIALKEISRQRENAEATK